MDLPVQYPYDPPWWIIIYSLVACTGMMILFILRWISVSFAFAVASITILLALSLSLAIRRVVFKRHLELGQEALLLPTGFFQRCTVRIPYKIIEQMWESRWAFGTVLYLRAGQRKFEILCGIFLDIESYLVVRSFLTSVINEYDIKK